MLRRICGIYSAIHIESGRVYIGQSANIGARLAAHFSEGKNRGTTNFHRALREFGKDAFDFSLIEECQQSLLKDREQFWISFFNSAGPSGFNTHSKASRSRFGIETNNATRLRLSAVMKGRYFSPEHRERISMAKKGIPGNVWTDESRKKLSATLKGRKGHAWSESSRAKMRLSRLGKRLSVETRKKQSDAHKGRKFTPEHCAKMSAARIGKKLTPESIAKRTESRYGSNRQLPLVLIEQTETPAMQTA